MKILPKLHSAPLRQHTNTNTITCIYKPPHCIIHISQAAQALKVQLWVISLTQRSNLKHLNTQLTGSESKQGLFFRFSLPLFPTILCCVCLTKAWWQKFLTLPQWHIRESSRYAINIDPKEKKKTCRHFTSLLADWHRSYLTTRTRLFSLIHFFSLKLLIQYWWHVELIR